MLLQKAVTASTSGSELPFGEDCLPTDCKASREAEQHQLLQILLPPPPSPHISMLQGKRLLSLNRQMGTLKKATCTVTEQAADTQTGAGKTHQLAAVPVHQALLQKELSCSQELYFSVVAAPFFRALGRKERTYWCSSL